MASKSVASATSRGGFFSRWVAELGFTWLGVLLISVAPAVLFGSAFFSIIVLAIGTPAAAVTGVLAKGSIRRGLRRLAILVVVPSLSITCVYLLDKRIPENATQLTKAIESFQRDTGHYPESLEALIPAHFAELPNVRFSVIQPLITYRITNGKPYLAIPSAKGDMFAQFEYNFETKVWLHQS